MEACESALERLRAEGNVVRLSGHLLSLATRLGLVKRKIRARETCPNGPLSWDWT